MSGIPLIIAVSGQLLAVLILVIGVAQTGAFYFLGLRQVVSPNPEQKNGLVINGLYRWVRHPLYSAGLLFIWLTPLMTTSVLALNIGLSFYIYVGSIFEERRLKREFGPSYEEYQRQVPRLFPRMWSSAFSQE